MKKASLLLVLITLVGLIISYFIILHPFSKSPPKEQEATVQLKWLDTINHQPLYHLVLGDSLAKGYGSKQGGYAGIASQQLQAKTNKEVYIDNTAVSGLTTEGLLYMLQSEEMQNKIEKADIITISIGGNNLLRLNKSMGILEALNAVNDEKKKYQENMEEILAIIRSHNDHAIIVLSELYNPLQLEGSVASYASLFIDRWNKLVYTLAEEHEHAIVLPIRDLLKDDTQDLLYDKVHPNDKGYTRIADAFVKMLLAYKA
ncbi:GDSL-type esterase/lipase family protein [Bacillus sp. 165]|uniref:GDSL-type esterase/lipase family protein n=1 Tax=Bacillus sp. 165 TaxID=1529117 RepID=UPI001ADD4B33|nr:GDSL-type esterase/lipase family protein [Bacillus sp. 165]MBO9129770.1 lipase [Bacillus sp. 165]